MKKLRILEAKDLEKIAFNLGFEKVSQKGSHITYRHKDGRQTTIPHHPGEEINRPLLRAILKEMRISIDVFNTELNKL